MLKKIGEIFFIIVLCFVGWGIFNSAFIGKNSNANVAPASAEVTREAKRKAAAAANIELNRGLPTMLDSETMLTKAVAETNQTTYYLTMVNFQSGELNQDFLVKAQRQIGKNDCADKDIRWSYEKGMLMKYIISGADHRTAGSFYISKTYCDGLK